MSSDRTSHVQPNGVATSGSALVEPLDFHKPRRPGLTSFRTLNRWWSESCARVNEAWATLFAYSVESSSVSIESIDLHSARNALPVDGLAVEIRIGEDQIPAIFCLSARQVRAFLADLLNQKGSEWPAVCPATSIELAMLEVLFERLTVCLAAAWPTDTELVCRLGAIFEQPQRTRLFAAETSMIMGTLNISSRFGVDAAIWLMPLEPIESLIEKQTESHTFRDQSMTRTLEQLAERLPVAVSVELGRTTLNMTQIADLAIGDLLVLDQSPQDELTGRVQGADKWKGRAVSLNSRLGYTITEILER